MGEKTPYLEITEVVLAQNNIVNNNNQQDSRAVFTFVPNKSFGQLSDISSENVLTLKTFTSEFSYTKVSFTEF